MQKRKILYILIFILSLPVGRLWSCDAPVFRYALERWLPSLYRVYLFHNKALDQETNKCAAWLEESSIEYSTTGNYHFETVNVTKEMNHEKKECLEQLKTADYPCLALYYPQSMAFMAALWQGKPSMKNARKIIHSPSRNEISKRILSGDGVIWLLIQSGNTDEDQQTEKMVSRKVAQFTEIINRKLTFEFSAISKAKTRRTRFSLISIPRTPEEEIFISILMHSEPGLKKFSNYPILFPVFGRGRILYALAGAGIAESSLEEATGYLTGICACELKSDNPGMDLLISADWEAYGEAWIDEDIPLVGLSSMIEFKQQELFGDVKDDIKLSENFQLVKTIQLDTEDKASLNMVMIITIISLVLITGGITVLIIFNNKRKKE
ncbi:MAG: hypothetical protein JXR70_17780 [Spirochaetales bacterium]|nr:hypothetical protein [Spirochaetales bacterium]